MAELWKQCGDWLVQLEVLPASHRICWPDATVQDLAYALRDGVLLCHLLHTIDPPTLEMKAVNQRPALAQFLCLKNIRLFLTSCSTNYEMKETDLFQPSMLYDYSDFAQVLHTLSRLSLTPRALAKGPAFPVNTASPTHDEEQIYRTLEDMVTEDQYADFYNKHLEGGNYGKLSNNYFNPGEKEEDIYEDLCSFNGVDRQNLHNFPVVEKRDYILKELLETESNYVEVLNMLRKHFIKPILSIKDTDKKIIFMNVKELGENHAGFYKDILEAVTRKSRKRVGEVFIEYKERFLKYGEFCAQLPKAHQHLEQLCQKNEMVREEICRCEQSAKNGKFRLGDLLAVPMQRILKYHLLLRELLQNTPQSHEEYHTIHQAYESMLDVSDYVNEVKRDSEQLQIIKEIQISITDWNMPPGHELCDYGRLRKDSELKIQAHDTANKKTRYVFVFDKMLLVCKAKGDHYSYKDSLKIQDYKVQDVSSRTTRDTRYSFSFMLVHKDNLHAYTLFARTEDRKNEWIQALREAFDNVLPDQRFRSTHDAVMHTFDRAVACAYCYKLLKGIFYQGYLCDRCKRAMHKECISLLSKCGSSVPPALPPRPPSIQLPSSSDDPAVNRLSSSSLLSVAEENMSTLSFAGANLTGDHSLLPSMLGTVDPAIPLPPCSTDLPPLTLSSFSSSSALGPDYVNTRMEEHPWYVGDLDREMANVKLKHYPVGTYLVRTRTQGGEQLGHALSLRTIEDTKHMKINMPPPEGGSQRYCLSESRSFRCIVELVCWYTQNSLKESFSGLDTTLKFPFKELSLVMAVHDFSPDKPESNMLPLKSGDILAILDRQESTLGWLKAMKRTRIGYIPKDFVKPYTPG